MFPNFFRTYQQFVSAKSTYHTLVKMNVWFDYTTLMTKYCDFLSPALNNDVILANNKEIVMLMLTHFNNTLNKKTSDLCLMELLEMNVPLLGGPDFGETERVLTASPCKNLRNMLCPVDGNVLCVRTRSR